MYPHEDLKHRIKAFRDFVREREAAYDDNGHGTHIAAIIGGQGTASQGIYRGVAPDCQLICAKVLDLSLIHIFSDKV